MKAITISPINNSLSDLYFHDFAYDHRAHEIHSARDVEHLETDWALPEDAHAIGIQHVHKYADDHGKHRQYPAGHFPLRGMDADLFLQPEPFARCLDHLLENFGEVASAFLLNQHGGNEDAKILNRNPACQIHERGTELDAVVLFFKTF